MKDIQLEELPKSKEFMKHVGIADSLTKETGFEHGFTFCKPNDKIIVDKMCVGDSCSISIKQDKCIDEKARKNYNMFHTHPQGELSFSVYDMATTIINLSSFQKQNVSCVKTIDNDNVLCEKYKHPDDYKKFSQFIDLRVKYAINPIFEERKKRKEKIKELIDTEDILFNFKTGKIIKQK